MSKNTRTRILLTAVAALLLVAMTVGGTLAWLQDTSDTVENTFTASNIDVELDEIQDEDKDNKESFQMIPGATIAKQPYVTVNNNDTEAWVIIKVEESANLDNFISYTIDDDLWDEVPGHAGYYYTSVDKEFNNTIDILTGDQVTVLPTVTKEAMATMTTNPTLSFKAYVIQKDTTNIATIEAAWAALFPTT